MPEPRYTLNHHGFGQGMQVHLPAAGAPISVDGEWYGEVRPKFQVIVGTPFLEQVYVRFNDDGTIAEVCVSDRLMNLVRPFSSPTPGPWLIERDGN